MALAADETHYTRRCGDTAAAVEWGRSVESGSKLRRQGDAVAAGAVAAGGGILDDAACRARQVPWRI